MAVLAGGLSKCLLFRNLQYWRPDFASFLEMTWSWLYAGRLLHDNVFGYHGAIHNFYLMLAFAPMTIALGAYGLILGLVLLHCAAVLRVATCGALDRSARLTILAGYLGPFACYTFDHPEWGFHPELLYPPLALLLAVELLEASGWRWVAVAGAIVLVKEDGAVVCAAVVLAHTVWRVSTLRQVSAEESRRALRTGLVRLLVLTAVFLVGIAVLWAVSRHFAPPYASFSVRLSESLEVLGRTLMGRGRPFKLVRIEEALRAYALISLLMLVPLGRRLPKGLLLFVCAALPLIAVLLVSSASYVFDMMLWPPRLATLQAAVCAALVFASVTAHGSRSERAAVVVVLAALSWGAQLAVLHLVDYSFWSRVEAVTAGSRPGQSQLTGPEERFLRCVSARLPRGLPMSAVRGTHPVFHRQSIVFERGMMHAWHPPRLRVVPSSDVAAPSGGICRGPEVGAFAVEAECDLMPLVASCGLVAAPGGH